MLYSRTMDQPWMLIRNPKSSSGKGEKRWPKIKAELQKQDIVYEDHVTERPGHATELVREKIREGARRFIAVGGDGTVNEVANGILGQDEVDSMEFMLGQIAVGTGNDWGRTTGIPKKFNEAIALLKNPPEFVQDVGLVRWQENGKDLQRYFLNMAGMGYDAFVGLVANEQKAKGKGGIMGYVSALLSCLMKFHALPTSFDVDGKELKERKVFSLVVGIGNYNGGGMKQCPDAIPDDGMLDLTIINDLSKFKVLRNVPRLFSGSFVNNKEVDQHRGKKILIKTDKEMMLEVDGENIGAGTAEFSIAPKRLRIVGHGPKK